MFTENMYLSVAECGQDRPVAVRPLPEKKTFLRERGGLLRIKGNALGVEATVGISSSERSRKNAEKIDTKCSY
jgi:hypothetical protein